LPWGNGHICIWHRSIVELRIPPTVLTFATKQHQLNSQAQTFAATLASEKRVKSSVRSGH
jgi:hypothetical protein